MPKKPQGRGRGRPISLELSEPQKRLLEAMEAFIVEHGISPTMREMADELQQGVANVFKLALRLERNGYITRVPGKSRSFTIVRSSTEKPMVGLVPVPLVGTVVAGYPLLSEENVLGELLVDAGSVKGGRHFGLKIKGTSMSGAGMSPGDMIIVRQQSLADHRDIVVALLNGDATVKRLHHRQGQISLLPENKRFKPIAITPDDDFRIIGKVVGIRRKVGK